VLGFFAISAWEIGTKQKKPEKSDGRYPTLGEAYRLKALFNDLWAMPNTPSAEAHLTAWSEEVERAGIQPFMQFAKTVKSHWTGIVRFIESRLTNGLLEGINHKIQLAKRRARGYRNIQNFINMAYFLCGKLDFSFSRRSPA